MKKALVLFFTIFISILIAGLFGIVHDQITYTISNEYYTKFKFFQFGLSVRDNNIVAILPNPRQGVAKVGFLATWWVGKYIGIIFGLVGLIFSDYKKMFNAIIKALSLTFFITIITALIGFFYGKYFLDINGVNWWFPENLIHKKDFIVVGTIHNFSYLGGCIGLIFGVIYLIRANKLQKVKESL